MSPISKTYFGLHVKSPTFLPDFNQIWKISTDFESSILNFTEIRPVGTAMILADRWMD